MPDSGPVSTMRDLSLARKLMIILMVTSVGALLLAGAAITLREIRSSSSATLDDLTSLGDVVAGNCAAALSFRDPDAARQALESLKARQDIARAALVLPDREIFSSYARPGEKALRTVTRPLSSDPVQVDDRLAIVRPIDVRGERIGYLYLECTLQTLQSRIRGSVGSVILLVLLAALFAYGLSLRLHRVVSEPIRRLSRAAHEVSMSRDYSVRVEWSSRDELGVLTESFNGMMAQIQAQEQALISSAELLRQSQKMEAIGQLAGGVAHDFNNLLTAILGYAAMLERGTPPADPRLLYIREIDKAGHRAANLVRQLLAFGRKQTLEPRVLRLRETLGDIEIMLGQLIPRNIRLVWATQAEVPAVKADPGQIQQAVVNLVVNARDAMPTGGTITIEVGSTVLDEIYTLAHPDARPGRYVVLSVSDTGEGIAPEIQAHIFEPFFTTKGVGKGTGLGLSTVYGIVKQSGGHLTFYSEPGKGTTFRVFLPALERARDGEQAASPASVAGGSETILLADDDPAVLELTRDILASLGYRVLTCGGGAEAIEVFESNAGNIDLLLTDFMMPGMNGRDLSLRLSSSQPALKTLIMSGYTDGALEAQGAPGLGPSLIQKPFTLDALAGRIRGLLDDRRAAQAA